MPNGLFEDANALNYVNLTLSILTLIGVILSLISLFTISHVQAQGRERLATAEAQIVKIQEFFDLHVEQKNEVIAHLTEDLSNVKTFLLHLQESVNIKERQLSKHEESISKIIENGDPQKNE